MDEENFRVESFMKSKLLFTKLDVVEDLFANLITFTVAIVLLPYVPVTRVHMAGMWQ